MSKTIKYAGLGFRREAQMDIYISELSANNRLLYTIKVIPVAMTEKRCP